MKWVTWENVGVDRIGCAWLILREIDPQAEFLFIPAGSPVPANAEPFDIPGVKYSHHGGHCSFHALLERHQLQDSILHRIARIIDEADTIQTANVEPAAQGLDLICEGLRLISSDDAMAIERGRIVYAALYARLESPTTSSMKRQLFCRGASFDLLRFDFCSTTSFSALCEIKSKTCFRTCSNSIR